jgi:hypothetical protein
MYLYSSSRTLLVPPGPPAPAPAPAPARGFHGPKRKRYSNEFMNPLIMPR